MRKRAVIKELRVTIPGTLNRLRNSVLFIFFQFCVCPLNAQTLEFKNYTTLNGLLTDKLYNVRQDKQGYLWIFSEYGTLKYNGREFRQVLKNLPIEDSFIYTFFENEDGKKWLANSRAKIYEVRNDSAILVPGIEKISEELHNSVSEITTLYVDSLASIYAITKGQSYKFEKKNGKYQAYSINEKIKPNCILVHTLRFGNNFLPVLAKSKLDEYRNLCEEKGIYLQLPDDWKAELIRLPSAYLQMPVKNMKLINGSVYFSCLNFIYRVKPNDTGDPTILKIKTSPVINYTKDHRNHLWVACLNDGLYELDDRDSLINHYFANTTVNDVLIDHENGLWVSTKGKGLFHCDNVDNLHFRIKSLEGSDVSLMKVLNSRLFIADIKGQIFMEANGHVSKVCDSINDEPLDISAHGNSYEVVYRFHAKKYKLKDRRFVLEKVLSEPTHVKLPTVLYTIPKSKDTVINIWRQGVVYSVNDVGEKQVDVGRRITAAALIGNELWLGTINGVYPYKSFFTIPSKEVGLGLIPDKEQLERPEYLEPTENCKIPELVVDEDNNLWACSSGNGLFKIKDFKLESYKAENGLPSNFVNHVSFTKDHSMLLSCNKGVFISHRDKITGAYKTWENIKEGEVTGALEFNNRIYIQSEAGLDVLGLTSFNKEPDKVHFNLSSVSIDDEPVNPKAFKKVESGGQKIEIDFDIITFRQNKPSLKYILTGPISDSVTTRSYAIKFERLTPGEYKLIASPDIANGEKYRIVLYFTVEPHFWQTRTFIALMILFLSAAIIFIILYSISYNRRKDAIRTNNEKLLLEYKLIALKAQINPHFMSNCLSAIQDLIMNGSPENATYYVAEFGLMVRQILDFSSRHLVTLEEEINLLKLYVELEQLRFNEKFAFKIHMEREIDPKKFYVPPLIFNPIVENAIWHGLLPVQGLRKGELHILIIKDEKNLVLTVQDNGAGRNPQKKNLSNRGGKSYGIKITEQRLSNLNYLYKITHSRMEYTDLYNEGNEPSGTRVTLFLPVNLDPTQNEED